MADILPPMPQGVPPGHQFWNLWTSQLRDIVNNLATSIRWINLDFSGSKIEDIASRDHNKLTSIQGGAVSDYQHVTTTQLGNIGNLVMNSKASDPTTGDISSGMSKLYKNTTTSTVKLWVNDGGTLKSVTLI